MVTRITLGEAHGSVTATLPADVSSRLRLVAGDTVYAVETEDGLLLTRNDPTFDDAMRAFDEVRSRYRDTLRRLAE